MNDAAHAHLIAYLQAVFNFRVLIHHNGLPGHLPTVFASGVYRAGEYKLVKRRRINQRDAVGYTRAIFGQMAFHVHNIANLRAAAHDCAGEDGENLPGNGPGFGSDGRNFALAGDEKGGGRRRFVCGQTGGLSGGNGDGAISLADLYAPFGDGEARRGSGGHGDGKLRPASDAGAAGSLHFVAGAVVPAKLHLMAAFALPLGQDDCPKPIGGQERVQFGDGQFAFGANGGLAAIVKEQVGAGERAGAQALPGLENGAVGYGRPRSILILHFHQTAHVLQRRFAGGSDQRQRNHRQENIRPNLRRHRGCREGRGHGRIIGFGSVGHRGGHGRIRLIYLGHIGCGGRRPWPKANAQNNNHNRRQRQRAGRCRTSR